MPVVGNRGVVLCAGCRRVHTVALGVVVGNILCARVVDGDVIPLGAALVVGPDIIHLRREDLGIVGEAVCSLEAAVLFVAVDLISGIDVVAARRGIARRQVLEGVDSLVARGAAREGVALARALVEVIAIVASDAAVVAHVLPAGEVQPRDDVVGVVLVRGNDLLILVGRDGSADEAHDNVVVRDAEPSLLDGEVRGADVREDGARVRNLVVVAVEVGRNRAPDLDVGTVGVLLVVGQRSVDISLGGRCVGDAGIAARARRELILAGSVRVVGDLGLERAVHVVDNVDLGVEDGAVVGEAAVLVLLGGDVLLDLVDEVALGDAVGGRLAQIRQVEGDGQRIGRGERAVVVGVHVCARDGNVLGGGLGRRTDRRDLEEEALGAELGGLDVVFGAGFELIRGADRGVYVAGPLCGAGVRADVELQPPLGDLGRCGDARVGDALEEDALVPARRLRVGVGCGRDLRVGDGVVGLAARGRGVGRLRVGVGRAFARRDLLVVAKRLRVGIIGKTRHRREVILRVVGLVRIDLRVGGEDVVVLVRAGPLRVGPVVVQELLRGRQLCHAGGGILIGIDRGRRRPLNDAILILVAVVDARNQRAGVRRRGDGDAHVVGPRVVGDALVGPHERRIGVAPVGERGDVRPQGAVRGFVLAALKLGFDVFVDGIARVVLIDEIVIIVRCRLVVGLVGVEAGRRDELVVLLVINLVSSQLGLDGICHLLVVNAVQGVGVGVVEIVAVAAQDVGAGRICAVSVVSHTQVLVDLVCLLLRERERRGVGGVLVHAVVEVRNFDARLGGDQVVGRDRDLIVARDRGRGKGVERARGGHGHGDLRQEVLAGPVVFEVARGHRDRGLDAVDLSCGLVAVHIRVRYANLGLVYRVLPIGFSEEHVIVSACIFVGGTALLHVVICVGNGIDVVDIWRGGVVGLAIDGRGVARLCVRLGNRIVLVVTKLARVGIFCEAGNLNIVVAILDSELRAVDKHWLRSSGRINVDLGLDYRIRRSGLGHQHVFHRIDVGVFVRVASLRLAVVIVRYGVDVVGIGLVGVVGLTCNELGIARQSIFASRVVIFVVAGQISRNRMLDRLVAVTGLNRGLGLEADFALIEDVDAGAVLGDGQTWVLDGVVGIGARTVLLDLNKLTTARVVVRADVFAMIIDIIRIDGVVEEINRIRVEHVVRLAGLGRLVGRLDISAGSRVVLVATLQFRCGRVFDLMIGVAVGGLVVAPARRQAGRRVIDRRLVAVFAGLAERVDRVGVGLVREGLLREVVELHGQALVVVGAVHPVVAVEQLLGDVDAGRAVRRAVGIVVQEVRGGLGDGAVGLRIHRGAHVFVFDLVDRQLAVAVVDNRDRNLVALVVVEIDIAAPGKRRVRLVCGVQPITFNVGDVERSCLAGRGGVCVQLCNRVVGDNLPHVVGVGAGLREAEVAEVHGAEGVGRHHVVGLVGRQIFIISCTRYEASADVCLGVYLSLGVLRVVCLIFIGLGIGRDHIAAARDVGLSVVAVEPHGLERVVGAVGGAGEGVVAVGVGVDQGRGAGIAVFVGCRAGREPEVEDLGLQAAFGHDLRRRDRARRVVGRVGVREGHVVALGLEAQDALGGAVAIDVVADIGVMRGLGGLVSHRSRGMGNAIADVEELIGAGVVDTRAD